MIEFKQISFKNFLSFGNSTTTIELNNHNLALVIGQNNDVGEDGMSRNGSGKSTIFQTILWCLYGKGISSIKQDDFINIYNKKNLSVTLTLSIDGDNFTITRCRKPNNLEIFRNGETFTLHSSKSNDDAIIELIGMDYDMFINTTLLTNHPENFMSLKPAQQKQFIENLFDINILSDRATTLKTLQKDIQTDIKLETQNINNIINTNNRITTMIDDISKKEKSWRTDKELEILSHEQDLDLMNMDSIVSDLESLTELEKLNNELNEVLKSIEKIKKHVDTKEKRLDVCNNDKTHLENGKCPRCKQQWFDKNEIDNIQAEITLLNEELENIVNEFEPLVCKETELLELIDRFKIDHPNLKTETEYAVLLEKIDTKTKRLDQLKSEIKNPYTEQLERLKSEIHDVSDETLRELNTVDEHYKILIKLLTDSKSFIRKNIIDQYVPFLNKRTNEYLSSLNSPHEFVISNDLTVDIKIGRRTTMSYGNLSTGEKLRVNLAVGLAFRDFINATNHKTNLLMIDELLDSGMDIGGIFNTLYILRNIPDTSVFVISHRDEIKTEFDQIITVSKTQGFSEINTNNK